MSNALQRLIYLCHVKNELNRRRRRFLSVAYKHKARAFRHHNMLSVPEQKHLTLAEAIYGYKKAREDMKAMTKEMRMMRAELGVEFQWSDWGAIENVCYWVGQEKTWIHHSNFKKYYDLECFEMQLFDKE